MRTATSRHAGQEGFPKRWSSGVVSLVTCAGVILLLAAWSQVPDTYLDSTRVGARENREDASPKEYAYVYSEHMPDGENDFFYREFARGDEFDNQASIVLFLHGMVFTSEDWMLDDLMLEIARRTGVSRAISMDLPGFGESPALGDDSVEARAAFMKHVVDTLQAKVGQKARFVIVSPSMSGSWSLPFLHLEGAEAVVGYIPVAISLPREPYEPVDVPTLAIFGEEDIARITDAPRLPKLYRNFEMLTIADAGHPAYLHQPKAFINGVVPFIRNVLSL